MPDGWRVKSRMRRNIVGAVLALENLEQKKSGGLRGSVAKLVSSIQLTSTNTAVA
jgi:hypothetical protein